MQHLRDGQGLTSETITGYLCDLRRLGASRLVEGAAAGGFIGSDVQPEWTEWTG